LREVVLDTGAAQFQAEVTKLAMRMAALGDPVYGASCVGVGKGSNAWSEEELKALELGVVGGFARGCRNGGIERFALLSAVGSSAKSRFRYVRVMGLKEEAVQGIGFKRLAIFRPGIIGGNVHTPGYVAWLGRLIPGRFGTIEQDDIGFAFVAEFIFSSAPDGVVFLDNAAMKQKSRIDARRGGRHKIAALERFGRRSSMSKAVENRKPHRRKRWPVVRRSAVSRTWPKHYGEQASSAMSGLCRHARACT
jgi:hypothetical protein